MELNEAQKRIDTIQAELDAIRAVSFARTLVMAMVADDAEPTEIFLELERLIYSHAYEASCRGEL